MASAQTSTPGDLRSDQTPGKDGGWLQSHFAEIDREALWRMGKLPVLKVIYIEAPLLKLSLIEMFREHSALFPY